MGLTFLDQENTVYQRKRVARIQKSKGCLAFSKRAVEYLDLKNGQEYVVAVDEEEKIVYLIDRAIAPDKNPVRVSKTGPMMYIYMIHFWQKLGWDYRIRRYTFSVDLCEVEGHCAIKLTLI